MEFVRTPKIYCDTASGYIEPAKNIIELQSAGSESLPIHLVREMRSYHPAPQMISDTGPIRWQRHVSIVIDDHKGESG